MPRFTLKKRFVAPLISVLFISLPTTTVAKVNIDKPTELSIIDVYNLAKKHDASLASAKARLDSKLEVSAQTRALFLPKISLSAESKINDSDTVNEPSGSTDPFSDIGTGPRHYNSHGFTLALMQPLFDINSIYKIPESKIKVNQAKVGFDIANQLLIARVGDIYINTLIAEEDLRVALSEERAIVEQLQKVKLAFELGSVTITDTHEAQAARDLIRTKVIATKNQLRVSQHKLKTLTGQENTNLQRIRGNLPLDLPQLQLPKYDKLLEAGMKANRSLILAKLDHALAKVRLAQAKGRRLPKINAFAAAGEATSNASAFSETNSETEFYSVGVELKVPLYTGGAMHSTIKQSSYSVESKKQALINKQRNVELELRQGSLFVDLARSQVIAFNQAVKTSTSSLDSTKVGFDLGDRTVLDVLAVQKNYYQALRNLSNAQYQYLLSVLGLSFTAGILSEKDLEKIAEVIDHINSASSK
ncbi:MAG: TolC family outer membrane protein [Gammaproteobacteria bacterium]|nr:TolC family outer membrane protein [Gammaproteobacteria bacterium]